MPEEQDFGSVEAPHDERIERVSNPHMDEILGKPFKVLDDGFVRVVDYLGGDESIVQAARVSYGKGTRKLHEDRGLIRYLMRHRHTTPFEMCEIKLHVRAPMDAWRQWLRHRTACLAEGTEVYFDLPGGIARRGNQLYKMRIEEVFRKFQPTRNRSRPDRQRNPFFRRDLLQNMRLRQINEDTLRIQHTRVVNVFRNGRKPVFRMTLEDGKKIECTADHRFLFESGWKTLKQAVRLHRVGRRAVWTKGQDRLYINGAARRIPAYYRDPAWLNKQYNVKGLRIQDIATRCGVEYSTVRKWLRIYGLTHEKGGRSKEPWNKGMRYDLGPRTLSDKWKEANRRARSGAASNFWRGGISTDRQEIGRWTTQIAPQIHARKGWTCQLCHKRAPDLRCHHVVPVWADPSLAKKKDNLTSVCNACHKRIAGKELDYVETLGGPPIRADGKKRPRIAWNRLTVGRLVRITKFEYVGEKETYDLEAEGPYHNFVANGIVTHNSINEYSTRYSIAINSMQKTPPDIWRLQAKGNRQGSEGFLDEGEGAKFSEKEAALQKVIRQTYDERLERGIAREQARKDLPLSTYTEAYWKIDLKNLLHFLGLRMDEHAQLEIRNYAKTIGHEIVAKWVPLVWEAFLDYHFNATHFSRLEADLLKVFLAGDRKKASELAESFGWLKWDKKKGKWKRNRERQEFERKMKDRFGFKITWKKPG
jgi:thymidylate synthase (FAD)